MPWGRAICFQLDTMVNVSFRGEFGREFVREDIGKVLEDGDYAGVQFIRESGLFFGDLARKAEIFWVEVVQVSQGDHGDGEVRGGCRFRGEDRDREGDTGLGFWEDRG